MNPDDTAASGPGPPPGRGPNNGPVVVGVAASPATATEFEALKRLFGQLPPDPGIAFVVLAREPGDAERALPALLAQATALPVERADGVRELQPGRVYVLPAHRMLRLHAGRLEAFAPGPAAGAPTAAPRPARPPASSETNLRLLVESTKDFAIITLDPEGLVTTWNEGAQRMFGFAPDEIVGRPVDVVFTPKDREDGAAQREMRIARDEGRASDERWHLRKDGSSFFCSGIMAPMLEDGRLVGYAKIARDLTDSKRAEIQLAALLDKEIEVRAELQRAISMKDEFLAVMSHELKHPLNLIHVNAELVARLPEARGVPALARAADVIRRAVLSQVKITDDLLDLSRLRTGKLAINVSAVPWGPILGRVVDAVREDARAKNLTVVLDAGPPNIVVRADPVRVEQIVWNLLSNALKFTPAGGTIELRLSQAGGEARLEVADSGQGIAADFIGAVFEMFRQADRSTTRTHGGMGIGLALVKHLVQEQGGRVAADSPGVGQGARFSVWLPLADGQAREGADDDARPLLLGLTLLVVDDTVDALESFAALLRLEGAEVTAVASAHQALDALQTAAPFDALLSDVAMPGMDGYELIRRVRSDPRRARLPAIALTGFGRSEDAHRATAAGFDAHLAKPVQVEQLADVLARLARPGPAR